MTAIIVSHFTSEPSQDITECPSSSSSSVDHTAELSDSEHTACHGSLRRESQQRRDSNRSVRFSYVQTREYSVVEESPQGNDRENSDASVHRSLGWDYTDRVIDIETHEIETQKERKDRYLMLIQDHIRRAERDRHEREQAKQQSKKRFKSKKLKSLWNGFLDGASRMSSVTTTPYG